MSIQVEDSPATQLRRRALMVANGILCTLLLFLAVVLTQKISSGGLKEIFSPRTDVALPPPPPPPDTPPPPPEQRQEEQKPELQQEQPLLNLSQLEAALNPGMGGAAVGDFNLNLQGMAADDLERIFEMTEIDRVPQAIYQVAPQYPFQLSRAGIEGRVQLIFIVDRDGRVVNPRVLSSTRSEFERPALDAIRQWRFEPGVKNGVRVQVRMLLPLSFTLSNR
jgi:protein TonB